MKTLYLHIGTQKTGTSSLQAFCEGNRAALNALGFEYPQMPFKYPLIGRARNGHFLIGAVWNKQGGHEPEQERELRQQGYATVAAAFASFDNVILSEERLWDYVATDRPTLWSELRSHVREWGCELKVIVYLRRQDQLAASWYNQMVKQGTPRTGERPWQRWVQAPPEIQLDFHANLQRVAAQVGGQNIIVRVYERTALERSGGIYADFLGCLGLQLTDAFTAPEREANSASLTPNILEVKRALNVSPHFRRVGGHTFRQAAEQCSAQPTGAPRWSLFSQEEAIAFLQQFEEGNTLVAREYLHREGPLFAEEVEPAQKWQVDNPWMLEDTVRYFQRVNQLQARMQERYAAKGKMNGEPPAEPFDMAAWLAYLQPYKVRFTNHYAYTVRCVGELFLKRQRDIKAGLRVPELDDLTVRYLVEVLFQQACKQAEAAAQLKQLSKEKADLAKAGAKLEAANAKLTASNEKLRGQLVAAKSTAGYRAGRFVHRVCSVLAHPSKIVKRIGGGSSGT